MFTRIVTRYFNQSQKHLNAPEMISKMKDLRNHIKENEVEIASLQKQVINIWCRSKKKKQKLTRNIKLSRKRESESLKISRKQSNYGLMPRRKAKLTNQKPFSSSLQVSSNWETTSITQNHFRMISTQQIWDRDSTIQWGFSTALYKSLR